MPRPDTLAIHAAERLLAWALVLVCVALLFAQAPHGGAFYWSCLLYTSDAADE